MEHWRQSTAQTEAPPRPEATAKKGMWLGERGHFVPEDNLCPLLKRKAKWGLVSCNLEPARNTEQILRWFYTAETELALKEFVCFTRFTVVDKSVGFPTVGASQVGFGGVLFSVLPWLWW